MLEHCQQGRKQPCPLEGLGQRESNKQGMPAVESPRFPVMTGHRDSPEDPTGRGREGCGWGVTRSIPIPPKEIGEVALAWGTSAFAHGCGTLGRRHLSQGQDSGLEAAQGGAQACGRGCGMDQPRPHCIHRAGNYGLWLPGFCKVQTKEVPGARQGGAPASDALNQGNCAHSSSLCHWESKANSVPQLCAGHMLSLGGAEVGGDFHCPVGVPVNTFLVITDSY
jgi:hypothetical protein